MPAEKYPTEKFICPKHHTITRASVKVVAGRTTCIWCKSDVTEAAGSEKTIRVKQAPVRVKPTSKHTGKGKTGARKPRGFESEVDRD